MHQPTVTDIGGDPDSGYVERYSWSSQDCFISCAPDVYEDSELCEESGYGVVSCSLGLKVYINHESELWVCNMWKRPLISLLLMFLPVNIHCRFSFLVPF